MFRLLLVLGAGLFLTLLIGGRDEGQARLGLLGAYDIAALQEDNAPASSETAATPEPVDSVVAVAAAAPAPAPAVRQVRTEGLTAISFATAAETPADVAEATGLTLSLPLVTGNAPAPATAVAPAPSVERMARVIGSTVNVRAAPSAKADILDRLARNETVTVIAAEDSGWTLIRIEGDGVEGYIASRYLAEAPAESALFPSE